MQSTLIFLKSVTRTSAMPLLVQERQQDKLPMPTLDIYTGAKNKYKASGNRKDKIR